MIPALLSPHSLLYFRCWYQPPLKLLFLLPPRRARILPLGPGTLSWCTFPSPPCYRRGLSSFSREICGFPPPAFFFFSWFSVERKLCFTGVFNGLSGFFSPLNPQFPVLNLFFQTHGQQFSRPFSVVSFFSKLSGKRHPSKAGPVLSPCLIQFCPVSGLGSGWKPFPPGKLKEPFWAKLFSPGLLRHRKTPDGLPLVLLILVPSLVFFFFTGATHPEGQSLRRVVSPNGGRVADLIPRLSKFCQTPGNPRDLFSASSLVSPLRFPSHLLR